MRPRLIAWILTAGALASCTSSGSAVPAVDSLGAPLKLAAPALPLGAAAPNHDRTGEALLYVADTLSNEDVAIYKMPFSVAASPDLYP